jgi:membrane protein implicated in regulation of membrane protease activity
MLELTVLAATMGLLALGAIWSGYVLTILWAWFIVPTFGLPPLALAPAIGLAVVASYLTHQYMPKVTKEGDKWDQMGHAFGHMALKPAMALLIGWITKQWM